MSRPVDKDCAGRAAAPSVSASQWISCCEKMPEPDTNVLIYYPRWAPNSIQVASLMSDGLAWDICGEFNPGRKEVTHWMPLPDAPLL